LRPETISVPVVTVLPSNFTVYAPGVNLSVKVRARLAGEVTLVLQVPAGPAAASATDSADQYVELRGGINATMSQTSTTLKNIDAITIGANGNPLLLP
jgi:hypothetical protein